MLGYNPQKFCQWIFAKTKESIMDCKELWFMKKKWKWKRKREKERKLITRKFFFASVNSYPYKYFRIFLIVLRSSDTFYFSIISLTNVFLLYAVAKNLFVRTAK